MMPRSLQSRAVILARLVVNAAATFALARAATSADAPSAHASDPRAVALADSMMNSLGGNDAWSKTGYLAFEFVVSRNDTVLSRRETRWDKASGRIRLSVTDSKGRHIVVRTDLAHQDGSATIDGAPADSAARKQWLDRSYAVWVNDTYWLLMPYKLHDPGVTLADAGVDSTGRQRLLHLSFENVGLTPKDQYWVHVDPKTMMVSGWEMLLQGSNGVMDRFLWTDWTRHGDIQLASTRTKYDGSIVIRFENIVTAARAPAGAFD